MRYSGLCIVVFACNHNMGIFGVVVFVITMIWTQRINHITEFTNHGYFCLTFGAKYSRCFVHDALKWILCPGHLLCLVSNLIMSLFLRVQLSMLSNFPFLPIFRH